MRGQIMSKQHRTENVQIKTNVVKIDHKDNYNPGRPRPPRPTRPAPPPPPRPRRRDSKSREPKYDEQQLTGLGNNSVCPKCGLGAGVEQANQFVLNYCDPCGEQVTSTDAGKVPDGAMQSTTALFFRYGETMVFPWQQRGNLDLAGKTYSVLLLLVPLLRMMNVVIVRENDGEFGPEIMAAFAEAFAQADPVTSVYPNWTSFGDAATEYFTITDTLPLRDVIPPGENGISKTILGYRTSSLGQEFIHNAPDLVNQGTQVTGRFLTDFSERAFNVQGDPTALSEYVLSNYVRNSTGPSDISYNLIGFSLPINGTQTVIVPSFSGLQTALPSAPFTVPAGVTIRTSSGTLIAIAGQTIQYFADITGGSARPTIFLRNVAAPTVRVAVLLVGGQNPQDRGSATTRLYITEAGAEVADNEIMGLSRTVIALPPCTQAEIIQANTKATADLMKTHDGVYAPAAINEPVFNLTKASEYRHVLLINDETDLSKDAFLYPYRDQGWYDTCDHNFMTTVTNVQGIAYAAKPFLKICKSVEAQPGRSSILAATTKGALRRNNDALNTAFAIADSTPHSFPVGYNGLGILYDKVKRALKGVARFARTADAVTDVVEHCVRTTQNDPSLVTSRLRRI